MQAHLQAVEQEFQEIQLPNEIEAYIEKHFPHALETVPPYPLNDLPIWYMGNIADEDPSFLEINDIPESFLSDLPPIFQKKANTLLTTCFDNIDIEEPWGVYNEFKIKLLCFAKLLHSFVRISDDGYNNFDPVETVNSLAIDSMYLGGIMTAEMFIELTSSDYSTEDDFELKCDAFNSIATDKTPALIRSLCKQVGGETHLLAMLWWSIWPNYSHPANDKVDHLFNYFDPNDEESIVRMELYEFLQDGYSDRAEND